MEKHCVSLEIAKQLSEAGWEKETEFWWEEDIRPKRTEIKGLCKNEDRIINHINRFYYPAPLATEILEELPNNITEKQETGVLTITKHPHYAIGYFNAVSGNSTTKIFFDISLLTVLAKMWLYLKKEKLL